jgi:hypothetical protein
MFLIKATCEECKTEFDLRLSERTVYIGKIRGSQAIDCLVADNQCPNINNRLHHSSIPPNSER